MTAIQMTSSDISTPLTRASTFAPVMAGFNGGVILGPAIGGALAHAVGPANTCFVVGGAIAGSALLAHRLVPETRGINLCGNQPVS